MKKFLLQGLIVLAVAAFGVRNELQQVLQVQIKLPDTYLELKPGANLSSLCRQWQQQQLFTAWQCQQLKLQSLRDSVTKTRS